MRANPFAEATVGAMIDAVAAAHGDREAIVFGDARVSFAELRDRAIGLARGLAALDLRRGDTVAIWLPNRPAWFYAQHACARLGAIAVGLNPRHKIEALLMAHPAIEQAFVVGVPDSKTNEAPVAYVIPKPGARVGEEELRAFCRERAASYKVPRGIRFVADVPRTPGPHGDKVQRVRLRELAMSEFAPAKEGPP